MDILYFLGYNIDEQLPWHSTISRTRQLYPATVFDPYLIKYLPCVLLKAWSAAILRPWTAAAAVLLRLKPMLQWKVLN
ncbi:hypothetical protein LXM25_16495 [Dyadobacter sp. LJ53]|nr:hypothetical protein [Dyadobacter chenwenxiniae]